MRDDLGGEGIDVHAAAKQVLDFWFALTPEQHFAKSPRLDAEIAERFGTLRNHVLASEAAGWRDDPETLLAAIVLLDQFSRNIHRGSAEAYAADPLARTLACEALEKGWDADMPAEWRQFLYLPLMHAEDAALQALSVGKFAALGQSEALAYAHEHRDVIARFGRFPTRNGALGRESTAEEVAYLSQPGVGW